VIRSLGGRYELFDGLGGSDTAHVYRAWDHQLQHVVAVKILDRRAAGNEDFAQAFERAATFAASLPAHPNIVSISEVGRDDNLPYFVMQFVTGQDLKALIAREAPLALDRAFRLCRQMAQGLAFAHQYGLVHGGVKPQNALVSAQDQVRLTDFGINRAEELAGMSPTAMVVVRSQYISPEQALGRSAEPSSDIYSLGVVLFEMLTGKLPFTADTPLAVAKKHVLEKPPNPRSLNPVSISPAAAGIVMKALNKNPGDRYPSAAAFAAALHEHLLVEKGDTPGDPAAGLAGTLWVPLGAFGALGRAPLADQPRAPAIEVPPVETNPKPRTQPISKSQPQTQEKQPAPVAHGPASMLVQLTRAIPVLRPRSRSIKTRRLPFTSLPYVIAVAIAAAGGWLAYKVIDRALATLSPTPTPVRRGQPAPGCSVHHVGPVRVIQVWAGQRQALTGRPITFEYKIANNAAQCSDVFLALTAFSDTKPGTVVRDPAHGKVIGAQPGVHVYQRQFAFPRTAAGQSFDMKWVAKNPARTQVFGSVRLPHVVTVTAG
jgi:serine/threonine protein kinase